MIRSSFVLRLALLFCLTLAGQQAAADAGNAVITITDGSASVVRAVSRSPLMTGVKVREGDILMVEPGGFVRVETGDGVRVDLGPGAQVLWLPRASGTAGPRLLHLLTGWIKVSAPTPRGATPVLFSSPAIEADDYAVILLSHTTRQTQVFAETGSVKGRERAAPGAPESGFQLKPGEFLTRIGDKKGAVVPRPAPEFVAQLPRPFLDTLPARYADVARRDVPLKPGVPVGYEEIKPWLQADPALRRELMPRWRARVTDPAFKAGLVANLKLHPEWERTLFPERFRTESTAGQYGSTTSRPGK